MNILVLSMAATEGGALSIMNNLYNEIKESSNDVHWYFLVSLPQLENLDNVSVLRYPWVKKNWFNRLYFDNVIAKKIVKENNIDYVFTLQNTTIFNVDIPQILYLHQPLPFVDKRYKINEDLKFWVYQNVIAKIIKKSLKQADKIIVQTNWLKDAVLKLLPEKKAEDIIFSQPKINVDKIIESNYDYTNKFFYPAFAFKYKNHKMIVEAAKILKAKHLDYTVDFTLDSDAEVFVSELSNEVKSLKLPINFLGIIKQEEVFERYSSSVLVFPSEIETFGLPLLEARLSKSIVLALNTPFARQILKDYPNAYLFEDEKELASLMKKVINKEIIRIKDDTLKIDPSESLMYTILDIIKQK